MVRLVDKWRKFLWDLERFGLTPSKWSARLGNINIPSILVISIPKAGTHLAERALCLHPNLYRRLLPTLNHTNLPRYGGIRHLLNTTRGGQILVSHLYFQPDMAALIQEKEGLKTIFVIRDPRDIVISFAFYAASKKSHPAYPLFVGKSLHQQIKLTLEGSPSLGLAPIGEMLRRCAGWMNASDFILRFEDIASHTSRAHAVKALYASLGVELDASLQSLILSQMISSVSPTFRRGVPGGWREYFDDEINFLFEELVGDVAKIYGY